MPVQVLLAMMVLGDDVGDLQVAQDGLLGRISHHNVIADQPRGGRSTSRGTQPRHRTDSVLHQPGTRPHASIQGPYGNGREDSVPSSDPLVLRLSLPKDDCCSIVGSPMHKKRYPS